MDLARPLHEALRSEYDGRVSLFECLMPGCRFRATLDHADGSYRMIDPGDQRARHSGVTGPLSFTVDRAVGEDPAA